MLAPTCPGLLSRLATGFAALSFALVPSACLDAPSPWKLDAELVERSGPPTLPPKAPLSDPPMPLLESSADDAIVLRDVGGGVLATRPAHGRVVDLSSDAERAYALAQTDDGLLLLSIPLEPAGLGAPVELGGLEGDGRVLGTPHGYVLFEHAMGPRWRLVGGSAHQPSRVCGRPQSIHVEEVPGGLGIEALVRADAEGRFELARATVSEAGLSACERVPLDWPADLGSPRLVWAGEGRFVVGSIGGALALGELGAGGEALGGPPAPLTPALPAIRVEGAVSLGRNPRGHERLAVLLGPEARVAVLALDEDGSVRARGELALLGRAFERDQYFGRDLLWEAGELAVATTAGVFGVRVLEQDDALALEQVAQTADDGARRGPLVHLAAGVDPG